MNARGNDIFVRAAEHTRHGLVLVDDVTPAALDRMERDGCGPAAVVETSPRNFQAWVRVPERASELERGEIARRLAREYDADPASASSDHYGRLAGFTNRKEIHRDPDDDLHPFALLRSARGRGAPGGELLLRQAGRALRDRARASSREQEMERSGPSLFAGRPREDVEQEATGLFRSSFAELRSTINDPSRCDFHAARRLVDRGFDRGSIERAMYEASPDLEERTRGHVQDYVRRTVDVAFEIGRERERESAAERANEPTFSRRPHSPEAERDATDLCRREIEKAARLIADPMRRDLVASTRLAEAGYGARTIEEALRAASPDLEERTRGQVDRYVKSMAELAVRAQARQIERDRDPDRGMER